MKPDNRRIISNGILLDHVSALLAEGKRVRIRARGGSMRPFICDRTDVIELVPPGDLRRGDIVLAGSGKDGYTLHRIIQLVGDSVVLAGDGNLYQEERFRRSDICGQAVGVIRNGKRHSLISRRSRLEARIWRGLLPMRRAMNILKRLINR